MASAEGSVTILHACERDTALRGIKNSQSILLTVATGAAPARAVRAPLHVSIVVDRSGSMSGQKMVCAKRAVRKLIKHLVPPDKIHFITFDDNVQTVFEDGNLHDRDALEQQVRQVITGGSTNISDALVRGAELLLNNSRDAPPQTIKRIFLFSDGQANAGISTAEGLSQLAAQYAQQGITINTFGIGSDFSEPVMRGIAEAGLGKFFLIPTADAITAIMSKAVHGLLATAGTNTRLLVRGLNGCTVTKIHGAPSTALMQGLAIGDLHYDNEKKVLVDIDIFCPPPGAAGADLAPVLEYSLVYHTPEQSDGSSGHVVQLRGVASMAFTDDWAQVAPANPVVAVAKAVQQAADLDEEATMLLEQGDAVSAIALKENSIGVLTSVAPLDPSGHVQLLLTRNERMLASLREQGASRRAVLEMSYERGLCRAMSVEALHDRMDSDEDRWSDDGSAQYGRSGSPHFVRQSSALSLDIDSD